ncbi:hypothetical protein HCH_04865 [Hahella chejuensis KCTC 2396]|uniref:Uncharacterized protein n=1 Tax=Hahella chejuensis (strain KCTC 2396) TaxID=349521 RepID=Q2SCR8_HAHCH|nr:hypothetical protein HCH_04865 [Hahella chejuensis KCTC 2396]
MAGEACAQPERMAVAANGAKKCPNLRQNGVMCRIKRPFLASFPYRFTIT